MAQSTVEATALKFDLETLKAKDYPRNEDGGVSGAMQVFTRVVTQCPYGDPAKLETWTKLPFRKMGAVREALQAEQKAVARELRGWAFDLEALNADDFDAIAGASAKADFQQGAALLAKYLSGAPAGQGTTAADLLDLPYYPVFVPLLQKLQTEALEELQAGFLNTAGAVPARAG